MSNDNNIPQYGDDFASMDAFLDPSLRGQQNQAGAMMDDHQMADASSPGLDTAAPLAEYGIAYDPSMDNINWPQLEADAYTAGIAPPGTVAADFAGFPPFQQPDIAFSQDLGQPLNLG
ncbi:hypothetical protein LTS18_006036, partial [Coniosporium uncinatum]